MLISILEEINQKILILSGEEVDMICDNRRILYNLESIFDVSISNKENKILISCFEKTEIVLNNVLNFLDRYWIKYSYSEWVRIILNKYIEEKEWFIEFSNKAKDIRNNICDKNDFKDFTEVLKGNKIITR